jgi:sugar/nucleoside kinase (ribokinase family)
MDYDVVFIGHMCLDEIIPFGGSPVVAPGSAVLCGAMVAARIGKRVAAVVKLRPEDAEILGPMQDAGVRTHVIPAPFTTYSRVLHESENVDHRKLTIVRTAGLIALEDVPDFTARSVHLAGISDTEFDLRLMQGLKARGYSLSVDLQSFVRQVEPVSGEIRFGDVENKRDIVRIMDKVKLDVVEARILTGTDDLEQAALAVESWGGREIMITHAGGVLLRANGRTYYERFSNASSVGRTGRGDTTFAAYLGWRLEHNVAESLRFAAALVSIKMESRGPFSGTVADVQKRIREKHCTLS